MLFVAMFLLYFSTAFGMFLYGDDISMLNVTESIVDKHSTEVEAADFPASPTGIDGNHYSKYGIGQSLLAIPFYLSGKALRPIVNLNEVTDSSGLLRTGTTIYVVSLLCMLATAAVDVLFYLTARELGYGPTVSFLATLCLGTGTFVWYYSRTFLAESTSMLAVFGAFYALVRVGNRIRIGPIAAFAICVACALLLRIGTAAAIVPLGIWFFGKLLFERGLSVKRFFIYAMMAFSIILSGLALIAIYDRARFGNVFETGYRTEASAFTTPLLVGVPGLLLSSGKGIFEYAPILILGCIGWFSLLRSRRSTAIVIASVVLADVLFYARWYQWWGGGVWGPRFLVIVVPLIALGIPAAMARARTRAQRWTVGALALVSTVIQLFSVVVPSGLYFEAMSESPELFDRYLWAPDASPIMAAVRTLVAGNFSPDLAPAVYGSAALAIVQGLALVAALGLFAGAARMLARERRPKAAVVAASRGQPIQVTA